MEFSSYDDMIKFEAERERFYLDFIDICNSFDPLRIKFYKRLFLETFHPQYRRLKKLYNSYYGGWWRDSGGHPCANPIQHIDTDFVSDGEICIERDDRCIYAVYRFKRVILQNKSSNNTIPKVLRHGSQFEFHAFSFTLMQPTVVRSQART